jgi:hypothetical protein
MVARKRLYRKSVREYWSWRNSCSRPAFQDIFPVNATCEKQPALATQLVIDEAILESMTAIGYRTFLTALRDSGEKFATAQETMKHAALFFSWTRKIVEPGSKDWKPAALLRWAKKLASKYSPLFLRYAHYLENTRDYLPSTVVIYLRYVKRFFAYLSSGHIDEEWRLKPKYGELVQNTLAYIIAQNKKRFRRLQWKRMDKRELVKRWVVAIVTVVCMVLTCFVLFWFAFNRRKMPVGGMQELRAAVAAQVHIALCFDETAVTPASFVHFIRTLAANFYVENVQGRAGGFHTMTLEQGQELLRTSEILLEHSKTSARYGYQPVAIGESSRNLLGCYIDRVRCTATNNLEADAKLWVNSDGTEFARDRFGRLVTGFFKTYKNL